jgi:hypothetical protein
MWSTGARGGAVGVRGSARVGPRCGGADSLRRDPPVRARTGCSGWPTGPRHGRDEWARPAATCGCRHECGHGPDVIMRCRSHRNGTLPTRCAFPAKRRLPCHAVHVELTLFRDGSAPQAPSSWAPRTHPNHTVLACRVQDYLRWRNANARPHVLAAQRRERARVRRNDSNAGADPAPPLDQNRRTYVASHY